jgi:RNA binding exosome subunit
MTAHPTYRDQIAALEHQARANGEADFASLLRAYRFALSEECRDGDECLSHADEMLDDAGKLYRRFEQAAGYLNQREDVE